MVLKMILNIDIFKGVVLKLEIPLSRPLINREADYSVSASVPLLNLRYCLFVAYAAPGPQ